MVELFRETHQAETPMGMGFEELNPFTPYGLCGMTPTVQFIHSRPPLGWAQQRNRPPTMAASKLLYRRVLVPQRGRGRGERPI
jgi:hypothetical protein